MIEALAGVNSLMWPDDLEIQLAPITGGPNFGKTESFERFPVKCPDNIVHELMTPTKQ
jgi:hypothetical protein